MPGNELGDRVHNFFAQDHSFQGQQQSQGAVGNWSALNRNFLVGGQVESLNSDHKNYHSQSTDGGEDSYSALFKHGPNFTQSNLRPDSAKGPKEQPNMNGCEYGSQFHQTRQNEENLLAMGISSRGLSSNGLQQVVPGDVANSSETPVSAVSFDLFGGQQQASHQQSSMPQFLQPQHSGINDMQQLQQQLMIKRFQELQRQQQLDSMQRHSINQSLPFAKQASGSQSTLVNGTSNSDTFQYPSSVEEGPNWIYQGSPNIQGSNGLVYQPNVSQTQQLLNLVPQQYDQSLYGVPVSSLRGSPATHYSKMMPDRSSTPQPQMSISSSNRNGNQHNLLTGQVHMQDESSFSRHNFHSQNVVDVASKQSLNSGLKNRGDLLQSNSMSMNASHEVFQGKREVTFHLETDTCGNSAAQKAACPRNEVSLDPEEEKILFGSDDNIWDAFGTVPRINEQSANMFGKGGLSNGLASIQSGSWSALMQSAVAETSSNNTTPQECSLNFHSIDVPLGRQHPSMHNYAGEKETSSVNHNVCVPSTFNSISFPPSDVNTAKTLEFNQLRHSFQHEPSQNLQTRTPYSFDQTVEESHKLFNSSLLQTPVASQHRNQADIDTKTLIPSGVSGQSRTRLQLNGWNTLSVMPPAADRLNDQDAGNLKESLHNSHANLLQGSGRLKSGFGKGINDDSVAKSYNTEKTVTTSPFVQNNSSFNQWRSAYPPARSQEGKSSDRLQNQAQDPKQVLESMSSRDEDKSARCETEKCDRKEKSSESHHSILNRHASHSFREGGLSNENDQRSLPSEKQKSSNQLYAKGSAPRKFLYHPIGNLDEDMKTEHNLQQLKQLRAMSPQNGQFGHSNLFGQVARNPSTTKRGQSCELPVDAKNSEKESSKRNLSHQALDVSTFISRPTDTYTSENSSSSSQNMLELLHKVDQEKDHTGMMQTRFFEGNATNQSPEAEKSYRVNHLQSSMSKGFGLHLGPPLQHSRLSQNSQDGLSVQFSPVVGTSNKFKIDEPATGGNVNTPHKMPGSFSSAFVSDDSNAKGHLQSQQLAMPRVQNSVKKLNDPVSGKSSCNVQRGSTDINLSDAYSCVQQDNIASSQDVPEQGGKNDVQEGRLTPTAPIRDRGESSQRASRNSAKMLHNTWTKVPMGYSSGQHQLFPSQMSQSPYQNILESSSSPSTDDVKEQKLKETSRDSDYVSSDHVPKVERSLPKELPLLNHSKSSTANSTSMLKEIKDFSQSLRRINVSVQPYYLPNQAQPLGDANIDVINGDLMMKEGPDNLANATPASPKAARQGEQNAVVEDPLSSSTAVIPEDPKMLSFSGPVDIIPKNVSRHGDAASQVTSVLSSSIPPSNTYDDYAGSATVEQNKVNPQMAPMWINSYGGSLKNGQVLQICDAHKVNLTRPGEPPFALRKSISGLDALNSDGKGTSAPSGACEINSSALTTSVNDHCSSRLPRPNDTGQHFVRLGQKKRKNDTFGLRPWHKEISDSSPYLGTHSNKEADWSKAGKRVIGKVNDIAEPIEDVAPALRAKRRLITSSHLMQQLIGPPLETTLSVDASSCYDLIAYFMSRIALGDACHEVSCANNLDGLSNSLNLTPEKRKSVVRNGARRYEKASKELIGRVAKMENELLRLEKSASLLDLRMECQDLERYSTINRFAKFHGRGQTDNAETISTNTTTSIKKPSAQRYATAVLLPKNLPESVQCLSL